MKWKACEKGMVCLTPQEAKEQALNNVKVARWVDRAWSVIRFHEARGEIRPAPKPIEKQVRLNNKKRKR